jgi:hypothetical protein
MKIWRKNKIVKLVPALALTFGVLTPLTASASYVENCMYDQCEVVFNLTGQTETFTLPQGVENLSFEAYGGQGGKNGGPAGRVIGVFNQIPSVLYVTVGGQGLTGAYAIGGFNGGGSAGAGSGLEASGGGATDIRTSPELSSRIVVAGGGGGRGSGMGSSGGAGGDLISYKGNTGQGQGGTGGTQTAGGIGGAAYGGGTNGKDGEFANGGAGGVGPLNGGGGGGGGYFGGGGGGPDADACCLGAGAGGGGSSYTDSVYVSSVEHVAGFHAGDGYVVFRYQYASPEEPGEYVPPHNENIEEPGPTNPEPEPSTPSQPEPEQSGPTNLEPAPVESTDPVEPEPAPTTSPAPESSEPAAPIKNEQEQIPSATETLVSEPELIPEPKLENEKSDSVPETDVSAPKQIAQDNQILLEPEPQQQIAALPLATPELRQAAQTMVAEPKTVGPEINQSPLLIGLLAVGVFALLAGLFVVRRGIPGAIAN